MRVFGASTSNMAASRGKVFQNPPLLTTDVDRISGGVLAFSLDPIRDDVTVSRLYRIS